MLQRFVSGESKRFRILSFRLCGECWAVGLAWIHGQMFELLACYS